MAIHLPVSTKIFLLNSSASHCSIADALHFHKSHRQILNLLFAHIASLVTFDAKPFHSAFLMGQSQFAFAAAFHLESFPALRQLNQTNSTNGLFFGYVFTIRIISFSIKKATLRIRYFQKTKHGCSDKLELQQQTKKCAGELCKALVPLMQRQRERALRY